MNEDKQFKIDIPESIEGYKVTLFWGLTIRQIVLVFAAILFAGFAIFNILARRFLPTLIMLLASCLTLLGIAEIRGRQFYRHLLFIFSYYHTKPKVSIYNHYPASAAASVQARQLVYQKPNNSKILLLILTSLIVGITLLILIGIYLYHVIHK